MDKVYKVIWEDEALLMLEKIDSKIGKKLYKKVNSYLVKSPKTLGEPLKHGLKGLWRYRYGDYRVIYEIFDEEVIISVVEVIHRRTDYK